MLISLASAKGAPGTTTSAHVLAAVWPGPVLLADADPAGSDLLYRLRTDNGLPLDAERGLLSLAAAVRNNPNAAIEEHITVVDGGLDVLLGMPRPEQAAAIASSWGAVATRLRTARDVLCDTGRLVPGSPSLPIAMSSDLLLLVSNSGKTLELIELVDLARGLVPDIPFILITSDPQSELARRATLCLPTGAPREVCSLGLTPTTSTTVMTVIGDVLVVGTMDRIGFTTTDYAKRHHGGYLGSKSRQLSGKEAGA